MQRLERLKPGYCPNMDLVRIPKWLLLLSNLALRPGDIFPIP